ncbi:ankyrin repeat domain-containing protein [uncultured Legionella sp.]|uniref:ankyrin repeat domain-containing protein n=1 Tax=uncultured Legionella sp. TaxID=210934 RepID=UPI00260C9E3A|nr:ankyrin repeat domain-containing protein [uncultured Legionella sp.]
MKTKIELRSILNSPEKLTDVGFMKERFTQLSELRELLNLLTEHSLSANRADVINLLLANNGILENLCARAHDVKEIVNLLPEAKDAIIEKINTIPSVLSKFVESGGLPNLRPLFEICQLVSQRDLLLKIILTNETLLLLSLQRFDHLTEMIYTLTKTDSAVMPTVLSNHHLLRLFLKEDLGKFISLLPAYKHEILDKILKEDVLFKEKEDLNASTLQELATCFPEQLEAITQKCKVFNETLFNEILQTSKQINILFLPARFNNSPLSAAVFNCEKEKVAALIKDGNSINAACSEGFTALHWACMRRDETLISELMSHGADPNVKNKDGKTPLDYYRYQIRVDDFKLTLNYSTYQRLKKEGILTSGPAEMKEFNLVFWNDAAKDMGATRRNQKPIKMDMFNVTKKPETEQLAVIATKQFIASPVFAAEVKTSVDHLVDASIQEYKKTNS